jgi:hypothetical protein
MRAARYDEPRARRAEHERERLPTLAQHVDTPSVVLDGDDRAALEAAAEVNDAHRDTDTRQRA